ncbi:MAG: hypothetical protein B7Y25_00010 [Alphaproteobacteria bacterium 16-39-46]|nr:MAG: hypothetical protein B7Y25_00010 [Alphaproteobacteria bacterium 16-39-46]OZA44557.1 MAG: hypothetical protein B7X84_00310 [Alphaproteobacteria bacterium 17-39-52]HQS83407.1 RidA family protein [Alphaproteobacteria bacterium]HQS93094.1 RidA family protein [Alphaproteobacteria bacterium]
MATELENRLRSLGIELPTLPTPSTTYAPFIIANRTLYISGQFPMMGEVLHYPGKIGGNLSIEDAQKAAHLCALNILAQVKIACDESFERINRCVRLCGFVNAVEDFSDYSKVMDEASNLMIQVFGNLGRHTRSAGGVSSLPHNACLEIDAIFALEDEEATPFS